MELGLAHLAILLAIDRPRKDLGTTGNNMGAYFRRPDFTDAVLFGLWPDLLDEGEGVSPLLFGRLIDGALGRRHEVVLVVGEASDGHGGLGFESRHQFLKTRGRTFTCLGDDQPLGNSIELKVLSSNNQVTQFAQVKMAQVNKKWPKMLPKNECFSLS